MNIWLHEEGRKVSERDMRKHSRDNEASDSEIGEKRRCKEDHLENVIHDAVTYTELAKRMTVTAMNVVYALNRQEKTLYGFEF
ncbi:hypothetical protein AAZX31_17G212500 [Glycine max]|uniref:Histone H4 n=2 Tax=Glycine subgen. Soja TaxID=1462606 RepID=I1MX83_SOYBN|nr:hypothetical protein JHK86_048427 [Glycine max]KAG4944426.1 hypothetical protein JHK85_049072 [Glycine max]KAG5098719.1 hypothetical protein JHK82_048573 [Glycine max]KAG5103490.1 hypothetical protein JHK84_048459 [Glycine max]KAH1119661.1 hypothetical protein GYH30_048159 [Glycine max]